MISAIPQATNAAGKNQTMLKGKYPMRSAKSPRPTRIRNTPHPTPLRPCRLDLFMRYFFTLPAGFACLAAAISASLALASRAPSSRTDITAARVLGCSRSMPLLCSHW